MNRMVFLPIATREMLVLSRLPQVYWGRVVTGFVVFLLAAVMAVLFDRFGIRGGRHLLSSIGFYMILFCAVSGAQSTADALSKEKRDGTLGLLLLTLLRPGDIVFGKLIAAILLTVYGLLGTLPMLSLIFLFGGIGSADLVRLFLSALNVLFIASAVGMFASAWCRERRTANGLATWILLVWFIIPGAASAGLLYPRLQPFEDVLWFISQLQLFKTQLDQFMFVRGMFWLALLINHGLGWLFLFSAIWLLPRKWVEKSPPKKSLTWAERWQQWTFGAGQVRQKLRSHLLSTNPFYWLAARNRLQPLMAWSVLALFLLLFVWPIGGEEIEFYLVMTMMSTVIYRIWLGAAATSRLVQENEQGTLELLLSTPLSVHDILRGQILWLRRMFAGPFAFLLFSFCICAMLVGYKIVRREKMDEVALFAILAAGFIAQYFTQFRCLSLLGAWGAMHAKQAKHAPGIALSRGFFLPIAIYALISLSALYLAAHFKFQLNVPAPIILLGFFVLALGNDLYWIDRVQRELPAQMRQMAFRRYAPDETSGWRKTVREWLAALGFGHST